MKRSIPSAVSLLLLASCSGQKQAQEPPPQIQPKRPSLDEFLPLEDKTISTFAVTTDLDDEEGMLVLEIFRPRAEMAELKIAGHVQRLLVEDKRISQAEGGILLEEPLEEGHTYKGSFGKVVIEKTDQLVEVPAGTYAGCVITLEESVNPPKRASTTYCPGIGLVEMKVESFAGEGAGLIHTRLTHHGPRVEIPQTR